MAESPTSPCTEPGPTAAAKVPCTTAVQGIHGLVTWIRDLAVSLAVLAFVIVFLYQPVKVEGGSMMPGLMNRERIFVNKFVYRLEPIERGDIVVFRYPRDPSLSFIKRVIGVPGDRIRIDDGQVYVNGNALEEDYLSPAFVDREQSFAEIVVPPHNYFVMGDHRNMSDDSRDFGALDQNYIYGKASFVYWPLDQMGKVR
jgi:signal peptidase I